MLGHVIAVFPKDSDPMLASMYLVSLNDGESSDDFFRRLRKVTGIEYAKLTPTR